MPGQERILVVDDEDARRSFLCDELAELSATLGEGLGERFAMAKQLLVCIVQLRDGLGSESVTAEADGVDAADAGGMALVFHEGRHVVDDSRHAADVCEFADGGVVVHRTGAADDGVAPDLHVTGEQGVVGDDAVVRDDCIVSDVAAGHDQIVIAEDRDAVLLGRAAVDGCAFAKSVAISNDQSRQFAIIADILRRTADHALRVEDVALAEGRRTRDRDVVR